MQDKTIPSLPQNDSPQEQQQRQAELQLAQSTYVYNFSSRVQPLGVAETVPPANEPTVVWIGSVALVGLTLIANVLAKLTKYFGSTPGAEGQDTARPEEKSTSIIGRLVNGVEHVVKDVVEGVETARRVEAGLTLMDRLMKVHEKLTEHAKRACREEQRIATEGKSDKPLLAALAPADLVKDFSEAWEELLNILLTIVLQPAGIWGWAVSIEEFAELFQIITVPTIASNYSDDTIFAWLRVAGPNPLVIQRVASPGASFPVTEEQYRSVMGPNDSLARAGAEGRLYLADYSVLQGVTPGTYFPNSSPKYIEAPLALFAVPSAQERDRNLRPVAIQLAQKPGYYTPIITPRDGEAWELAKTYVNSSDGNYHEMISHLGHTHLVIEEFAMATPRRLAPQHPLYVLLVPHLVGTLFINNAAVNGPTALIAPNGLVDIILAGTIQASTELAVQSVQSFQFNQQMLPVALKNRGVTDPEALPLYPYRDDALLLWEAIRTWVGQYLSIYYTSDTAVQQDYELQAWLGELASPTGGNIQDIGPLDTLDSLVSTVTMVIFTASVQHATVNFPQASILSFAPAMPGAAYAPPPITQNGIPPAAIYSVLPPLQIALVQLLLAYALGSVYYSQLGGYDRNIPGSYFTDERVRRPLQAFQANLVEIERIIGRRNLTRIPYLTLLPPVIPQSINI